MLKVTKSLNNIRFIMILIKIKFNNKIFKIMKELKLNSILIKILFKKIISYIINKKKKGSFWITWWNSNKSRIKSIYSFKIQGNIFILEIFRNLNSAIL